MRAGVPSASRIGTRPTSTTHTPTMIGVAAALDEPCRVSSAPSPIVMPPSSHRRRRFGVDGSGRLRIAVEIVIALTRHAAKATTTSVRSTPSAKAMPRLRPVTAYRSRSPASASAAPNASAMTITIPYATTAPSSAPTAAAARSYARPSYRNICTR